MSFGTWESANIDTSMVVLATVVVLEAGCTTGRNAGTGTEISGIEGGAEKMVEIG